MRRHWSRRAILRSTAAVGAVTALPPRVLAQAANAAPYANLSAAEAATLEAIVARLIPADANGPGALEAGAARYIDGALGSALAAERSAYAAGLAAVEAYARSSAGNSFAALSAEAQDTVLTAIEQDRAPGFTPSSAAFFDLVLEHTLEGMFCDPHYGGNQGFVGWELVGYPGVRLAVSADEQRMSAELEPNYSSAYDNPQFDLHETEGERHDD